MGAQEEGDRNGRRQYEHSTEKVLSCSKFLREARYASLKSSGWKYRLTPRS